MEQLHSHKQLIVWQKSMDLVEAVYKVSTYFPSEEKFGLASQMRRSAVSIPSNIAEGRARSTRKDFTQFLHVAYGSLNELETQLEIARRLSFSNTEAIDRADGTLLEVKKMLSKMISSLKAER